MASTPSEAFAQAIREARKERGLTQEQVCLEAGIDRAHYSQIEGGIVSPTLTTVWKIAAALEVPASDLFIRAERI